jgi:hypothetical protein
VADPSITSPPDELASLVGTETLVVVGTAAPVPDRLLLYTTAGRWELKNSTSSRRASSPERTSSTRREANGF